VEDAVTKGIRTAIDSVDGVPEETEFELYELGKTVVTQAVDYSNFYPRWTRVVGTEVKLRAKLDQWSVPLVSHLDGIVEHEGSLWGLERKWVNGQFRTDAMLELDGQTLAYTVNARANGYLIKGIIYDQINLPPKPPKQNKDGSMSRVKAGDWRTYRKELLRVGLDPADYTDMEESLPYTSEFKRNYFDHTEEALKRYAVTELTRKIRAVSSPDPQVLMCEDRIRCSSCRYRDLCLASLCGYDEDAARRMFSVDADRIVRFDEGVTN
jgi:hypothetical protein